MSLITPTLNPGAVLEGALDSVRAQDFSDYEHLVIDGASTDGTQALLEQRGDIRWVSEPDPGVYAAMNRALDLAEGDWLYFLGADDRLTGTGVLSAVSTHLNDDVQVVYGDVTSPRFGGRYGGEFDAERILSQNICHQALFVHRSVFERVGRFDERYPAQADWDHNMRWMLDSGIRHRWVDMVVADYADGGLSSTLGDPQFERDRRFNYLTYGEKTLPSGRVATQAAKTFGYSLARGDFNRLGTCLGWMMRAILPTGSASGNGVKT